MGTLKNMTSDIEKVPLMSVETDEGNSFGVHLSNLKKKSLGYYNLSKKEIVVFLPKNEFFTFELGRLLIVKESDDEKYKKGLKDKSIKFDSLSSLIFNKPQKKYFSKLFDRLLSCCGSELNSSEAFKLASECEDFDGKMLEIMRPSKIKEKEKDKVKKKEERVFSKEEIKVKGSASKEEEDEEESSSSSEEESEKVSKSGSDSGSSSSSSSESSDEHESEKKSDESVLGTDESEEAESDDKEVFEERVKSRSKGDSSESRKTMERRDQIASDGSAIIRELDKVMDHINKQRQDTSKSSKTSRHEETVA